MVAAIKSDLAIFILPGIAPDYQAQNTIKLQPNFGVVVITLSHEMQPLFIKKWY